MHIKEVKVLEYINSFREKKKRNPTINEICASFTTDQESIALAIVELGIPNCEDFLQDLKNKLHHEVVKERVENYSSYPKLFKMLLEQDLMTAYYTFKYDLDKEEYGQEIIKHKILDKESYVSEIKDIGVFPDNRIYVELEMVGIGVKLPQHIRRELHRPEKADFDDGEIKALYLYFRLNELAVLDETQEPEILDLLKTHQEKHRTQGNIFLKGKFTKDQLVFTVNLTRLEEILDNFEEPKMWRNEEVKDTAKEVFRDSALDIGADVVGSVIPGAGLVKTIGEAIYKFFKGVKSFMPGEEIRMFQEKFTESGYLSVKDFYQAYLIEILTPFFKKNNLSLELLREENFQEYYKYFMQNYENKVPLLSKEARKKIQDTVDPVAQDTLIFLEVSEFILNGQKELDKTKH